MKQAKSVMKEQNKDLEERKRRAYEKAGEALEEVKATAKRARVVGASIMGLHIPEQPKESMQEEIFQMTRNAGVDAEHGDDTGAHDSEGE